MLNKLSVWLQKHSRPHCHCYCSGQFIREYVGEILGHKEFKHRVKQYARDQHRHYYFMALNSDEIIDATQKGNISRFINHSCDPNAETQKVAYPLLDGSTNFNQQSFMQNTWSIHHSHPRFATLSSGLRLWWGLALSWKETCIILTLLFLCCLQWTVNGKLRIGFFAKRDIQEKEEITFDYQFERYGWVISVRPFEVIWWATAHHLWSAFFFNFDLILFTLLR